jgi:hypothetical protein
MQIFSCGCRKSAGAFLFLMCGRLVAGFFRFSGAPVMKLLLFPFRVVLSLVTGTLQVVLTVLGAAALIATFWIGPPTAPPRFESAVIPGSAATTAFEQGVISLALQHTEWTVSQPCFVSIASGQLPNGQDMTFIGLCGRWFPIPQEFPGVTGGALQNGEEETR